MYAGGAPHRLREPCRSVLRLVEEGRLPAATSAEVIQEILHRFVALQRPDLGSTMAAATLDLLGPVLPVTHAVMQRTTSLVKRYPALSARDLVHVATCMEEGIELVVTPDLGFDTVSEVHRIPPEDEGALASLLG